MNNAIARRRDVNGRNTITDAIRSQFNKLGRDDVQAGAQSIPVMEQHDNSTINIYKVVALKDGYAIIERDKEQYAIIFE